MSVKELVRMKELVRILKRCNHECRCEATKALDRCFAGGAGGSIEQLEQNRQGIA